MVTDTAEKPRQEQGGHALGWLGTGLNGQQLIRAQEVSTKLPEDKVPSQEVTRAEALGQEQAQEGPEEATEARPSGPGKTRGDEAEENHGGLAGPGEDLDFRSV